MSYFSNGERVRDLDSAEMAARKVETQTKILEALIQECKADLDKLKVKIAGGNSELERIIQKLHEENAELSRRLCSYIANS